MRGQSDVRGANETSVLDKINSFALISNCSAGEGHVSTDASCARESEQHNNDVNDLTPPQLHKTTVGKTAEVEKSD